MKYLLFGFVFVVSGFICSGQTFRSGFNKREHSPGGGNGQGASFETNVAARLHNQESVFLKVENDSGPTKTQNRFYACAYGILNYLIPYYSKESATNLIAINGGAGMQIGYRFLPNVWISTGMEYNFLKTVSIEKELNIFGEQWKRTREYTVFSLPVVLSLATRKNWKISPELNFGISFENLIKNSRISCANNFGCQTATDFINGDWALSYRVGLKANAKIHQKLDIISGIDFIKQNQSFESAYVSGSSFVLETIRLCFGLRISI